jgi:hypothetical protein
MTKDKSPSTVTADIKRNRLVIKLRGDVPKRDVERLYTDIRFCVSDLKPGFAVITDLSEARIGHLSAIDTFKKITNFLTEKQVGPVIRIVGQARVIFQQIAKLTKQITGYQAMYAKTMEEAEVLLADLMEQTTSSSENARATGTD